MDLFRFMVFHAYSSLSGIITMIFGLGSLIMLPITYFIWKDGFVSLILLMVVIIYGLITPLNMLSQSKRQVMSNPVFKNPITYHISDEIFEVQQYTGTVRLFWNQLFRIKKTPFDFLFYVNEQQAFVVPKKSMTEAENISLNQILDKVSTQLPKQPSFMERLRGQTGPVGAQPVKEDQIKVHAVDQSVDKEEKKMIRHSYSTDETYAIGKAIGERAQEGQVYALIGDLGVGKTVFTKGFAAGLGIDEDITSPTFTLVNEYEQGRLPFYHFDVYRIEDETEIEEIGYEEYFYGKGVTLVEWANKIKSLLPKDTRTIIIEKDLEQGFEYRKIQEII